ncbi:protein phosphatase inhibitor 2 [Tetranychus urticae]|uniref:Protein phosphatase inhibitor 2 n=1 Tax=Tetranychus urticae TaxID=32264 RepID=T1L0K0_TETUR|nr:protein phosphatase inhibitor 2 [Tetranychus urticae]
MKTMENLAKKPAKGILRTSSNSGHTEQHKSSIEPIKWDEMNILQTLHPPGKDYGLMKIEEPKTPYSHYKDTVDGEQVSDDEEAASSSTNLNLQKVSEKIKLGRSKVSSQDSKEEEDSKEFDDDDDQSDLEGEELTEEEKKKRREFEMKRKMHYNEFQAVKLARKLLEEEDDDEEDDDDNKLSLN